jgi:NAD(P)-dependent dehydrogenase (short-subunit alcohol dehydrogenase family)
VPGPRVQAIAGDVIDAPHRERLIEAARATGGLDLLVNNASDLGETPLPPLGSASIPLFRRTLEVNLLAPVALAQLALPLLRARQGLVVNLSSDAAIGGYPGWGTYGASKAALDLVSKTLAEELRSESVAVVSVDPGDMRTRMQQAAYPGVDIGDRPTPDATLPFWAWLLGQDPLRITGQRYQAQATLWEVPA